MILTNGENGVILFHMDLDKVDPSTAKTFPPPPFLQELGSTESVRTPLGHYRTESLFLERWRPLEAQRPVYSLFREDREDPKEPGRKIYSFQREYIRIGDPTGYRAAVRLLGEWRHWVQLREAAWFKPYLLRWNEEIVAGLNSRGLDAIVREADKGDLKAAEYLIGYTTNGPTPKKAVGRPSKPAKTDPVDETDLTEDAARIQGTT